MHVYIYVNGICVSIYLVWNFHPDAKCALLRVFFPSMYISDYFLFCGDFRNQAYDIFGLMNFKPDLNLVSVCSS